LVGDAADAAYDVEVAGHDGEGLCWAVLALTQFGDGVWVGSVNCEVEPAHAADGEDAAVCEAFASGGKWTVDCGL
jgi:hypothetical protein